MAGRLIQFPPRNAFYPRHNPDALARDTQDHASRIAMQVEEEIARKASRLALGERIQLAEARSRHTMPQPRFPFLQRLTARLKSTWAR